MKLKILSVALIIFIIQLASNAAVTVDKTLTKEYMMNNGYSKQIYDTVNISRARALGEEFYSSQELELKNMSKTKRFFKKLQNYIDPAMDDYSFYHHDILPENSYSDL